MSLTAPYRQHHYIGECADETNALTFIVSNGWDAAGSPQVGMLFWDSSATAMKYYDGTAWQTLGTSTAPNLAAVLAQGNDTSGNDIDVNVGDDLGIESGASLNVESGGALILADLTNSTFTGTPVNGTDPVNKAYTDAIAEGLSPKPAARVATTTALSTWAAAGSGIGKTLTAPDNGTGHNDFDGVTVVIGNRVLVKNGGPNATPAIDNGIYEVTALGNGVDTACELTRATDFDTTIKAVAGSHLWVTEGATQDNTAWVVTTNDPITVDTTAIDWSQYGGQGALTGGNGIDISVGVVSADLLASGGLKFAGVGSDELAVEPADFVGLGLADDGSDNIDIDLYATKVSAAGSGDVANNPLYLDATNGVNVKVDASTIDLDAGNADRLYVPAGGITETQLNSSVAGAGLVGGGGSALRTTQTGAGNPNGSVTGVVGEFYIDTTNFISYQCQVAGMVNWVVI